MPDSEQRPKRSGPKRKVKEAMAILRALGFGPMQRNERSAYVLLAMLDIGPQKTWDAAGDPLRGITPIIDYIDQTYRVHYAPNTRETIRDDTVKHFVESGLLVRNPDVPTRPTNSGNTVYQIEPSALALVRTFGTPVWTKSLRDYLASREEILKELSRGRFLTRIPVKFPSGEEITLSPGGQNPLIKTVIEVFCPRFAPGATIVYVGDAENKFQHFHADYLAAVGVTIEPSAKMPDVVAHDTNRDWLLLIEAVTSTGVVDGKRRKELKDLFSGYKRGLVFVTAFDDRTTMARFLGQVSWETEVWVASDPDHLIHFNGERFLGPYPDTVQGSSQPDP